MVVGSVFPASDLFPEYLYNVRTGKVGRVQGVGDVDAAAVVPEIFPVLNKSGG